MVGARKLSMQPGSAIFDGFRKFGNDEEETLPLPQRPSSPRDICGNGLSNSESAITDIFFLDIPLDRGLFPPSVFPPSFFGSQRERHFFWQMAQRSKFGKWEEEGRRVGRGNQEEGLPLVFCTEVSCRELTGGGFGLHTG